MCCAWDNISSTQEKKGDPKDENQPPRQSQIWSSIPERQGGCRRRWGNSWQGAGKLWRRFEENWDRMGRGECQVLPGDFSWISLLRASVLYLCTCAVFLVPNAGWCWLLAVIVYLLCSNTWASNHKEWKDGVYTKHSGLLLSKVWSTR